MTDPQPLPISEQLRISNLSWAIDLGIVTREQVDPGDLAMIDAVKALAALKGDPA